MRLISALLLSLIFFPLCSQADFAYYSNRHMAQISDLIVVGNVKVVEDGRFYGHKQKVFFEVETYLKGSAPKNLVILGRIDFICDLTNYKNGRYLLFLHRRENSIFETEIASTFVSVNFENGIREIIGNSIWWRSERLTSDIGSYKNLEFAAEEIGEFVGIPWNKNIY